VRYPLRYLLFLCFALLLSAGVPGAESKPGKKAASGKPQSLKVLVLERTVTTYGRKEDKGEEDEGKEDEGEEDRGDEEHDGDDDGAKAGAEGKIVKLDEKKYTVKLAAGRVRELSRHDNSVTVIRSDLAVVWFIDARNRTYRAMTFRKINDQAAEAIERLKRRLPIINDPAENKRIRELLGISGEPPKLTIERPGDNRKIAGEICERVVVKLGGRVFFKAWVSRRRAPGVDKRWLTLGCYLPAGAAEKLAGLKGLLVEAVFPLPRGGRMEIRTQKITEAEAAPGDFDDPDALGYKKLGKRGKPAGKSDSDKKKSK